jgi:hypothetical protein
MNIAAAPTPMPAFAPVESPEVFCVTTLDVGTAGWVWVLEWIRVAVLELGWVVICMVAEEKDARSFSCHRIWIG